MQRGFLRKLPHRARSIELLKSYKTVKNINKSNTKLPELNGDNKANTNLIDIPLVGSIAAGSPIDAIYNENEKINVPSFLLGKGNSKDRISYEGLAHKFPLGGSEDKDRRVEILILSD